MDERLLAFLRRVIASHEWHVEHGKSVKQGFSVYVAADLVPVIRQLLKDLEPDSASPVTTGDTK